MPQFEYHCQQCGLDYSLFQSRQVAKWDLMDCPRCGARVNIVDTADNHKGDVSMIAPELSIRGRGKG